MILDEVRKRLTGDFKPFLVRMSDGREYPVLDRFAIIVGPRVLVLLDDDNCTVRIEALHVVGISDMPAKRRRRSAG